jgi:hypothetical protein
MPVWLTVNCFQASQSVSRIYSYGILRTPDLDEVRMTRV